MSRRCEITGKGGLVGYQVSHSHIRTKKRQLPNVQSKRVWVPEVGRFVRLRLSTRAIRSITKTSLRDYCSRHGLDFDGLVRD
jgi:large subunit ribosomal protein L28